MRDYTARFIQIPMRDGIELGAVLYLPAGAGRVPAVMEMTPYLADNAHPVGVEFAREGLAFVAVDCRGRGGSGGRARVLSASGQTETLTCRADEINEAANSPKKS